jgi:flavodoxin
MDARLVLVLAVLLVGGTSDAMQVFDVPDAPAIGEKDLETLLRERAAPNLKMVARLIPRARDWEQYKDLIEINNYEDSDCTQAKVHELINVCAKYSGILQEYCVKCIEELKSYCRWHPNAVLAANIESEHLDVIKRFEHNLAKFIARENINGREVPREIVLRRFFTEEQQQEPLENLKDACNNYLEKSHLSWSHFETHSFKRSDTLMALREDTQAQHRRLLFKALEDCNFVVELA